MFTIDGKYNKAHIMLPDYSDLDQVTYAQIVSMVNSAAFEGDPIVIMPDCHKGEGSCIGFTMPLGQYIMPQIVGVDLGCGMSSFNLGKIDINFEEFDKFIRSEIPLGFNIHSEVNYKIISSAFKEDLEKLSAKVGCTKTFNSIGSLGSGNHFLECDQDAQGNKILVVHTGSRNLGKLTCDYHQKKAKELTTSTKELNGYTGFNVDTQKNHAFEYLVDMQLCQEYAVVNRSSILSTILKKYFNISLKKYDTCIHNFIDPSDRIVRKGAIKAKEGEFVIIPLNMRDGIIFGTGKSGADWNYSAPHGAGRLFGRGKAKASLELDVFKESMKDVYSTCIDKDRLDEAPQAYKDSSLIIDMIKDIVDITCIAKPVYNIKG